MIQIRDRELGKEKLFLFRGLYWDLANNRIRDEYKYFFIKSFPGRLGIKLRRAYWCKRLKKCGAELKIYENVLIKNPHLISLGNKVSIGANSMIEGLGELYIGDNFLGGPCMKIWTVNHVFSDFEVPINNQGLEKKKIIIGNDVWIGANAFIMPGTILGDKCVVSAHSVVAGKKYSSGSILAGHPARKIGERCCEVRDLA